MTDTKIILNVIKISIPDDHPHLYLYIIGDRKDKERAVISTVKLFEGILTPPYSIGHVRRTVKTFFKRKKEQYLRGEIKISSIY
tara:strand:- start:12391 stop:12642 length:252 start_codon:yes stop_codon:yes gene_type:complete